MFKNSPKSKKGPWIPPPGRTRKTEKSRPKLEPSESDTVSKSKDNSKRPEELEVSDILSICSSTEDTSEFKFPIHNIKQEQRILNLYFMSLRPISLFLNRFFSNSSMQDPTLLKLLSKVEEELNFLVGSFEDLEYSLSLYENTAPDNRNCEDFLKITKMKENLLLKLLGCYTDILTMFQIAVEEQCVLDKTKQDKTEDNCRNQLQSYEEKFLSQTACIKDLERRLSILQGKYSTIDSYNTTLVETKDELQKIIQHKDIQIKNLTSEINEWSLKQSDEKLIELIQEIKTKAQAEKTALKKAIKAQNQQTEQQDQLIKKLEEDKSEKVKMLFELASQRDQLKVQMTVANNEIVQTKYQIEEIKSQKLKVQNQLSEAEITFKNKLQETTESLKSKLAEAVENNLKLEKANKNLKEELESVIKGLQTIKSSQSNVIDPQEIRDSHFEDVKNLIFLLQETKECFKNLNGSDLPARGDYKEFDIISNKENILTIMQDIKRQISDLKRPIILEENGEKYDKIDIVKKLEELEHSRKTLLAENAALKSQIEELKKVSNGKTSENYTKRGSDYSMNSLQIELELKKEEVLRTKQREEKLERQLEQVMLQKKEMETSKLFHLEESLRKCEEELKTKKIELSLLEQKKQEESERLLCRTKELQEALDEKTASYESLQRYVNMLKSSLYNVFGSS